MIVLKRVFWNRGWEIREYVYKILTYLFVHTKKFMDSVLNCSWGRNIVDQIDKKNKVTLLTIEKE